MMAPQDKKSNHTISATRKHITVDVVSRLKPGNMVWDAPSKRATGVSGFAVRCQRRDKVYILKTRVNGRVRYFTIGKHGDPWTPAQARKHAEKIKASISAGEDPAREREAALSAPTVVEVTETFINEHVSMLKPSTAITYREMLARFIVPKLGSIRIAHVTERDVATVHHGMRNTPRQANLCLSVLSKLFSWCEKRGYRSKGTNPCFGIERFKERKRERFLSTKEFGELGSVLAAAETNENENIFVLSVIRFLMLTGARVGEALSLKWEHVDFERSMLHLPESKTGEKTIYLNAPVLQLLASLPRAQGNPYVFPGQRQGKPLVNIQKPWRRIRSRAGLEGVRLHDLRHSYASVAVAGGGTLPMIGKILGHSNTATTERYAHLEDDPVRQLNEKAGSAIAAALSADCGDVVKIGGSA